MAKHRCTLMLLLTGWCTALQACPPPCQTQGACPRNRLAVGPQASLRYGGKPVVLAGDSITQAWMETGSDFDHFAYLDDLQAAGINATLLWSFIATGAAHQTADARIGYDAPERWPWCGSTDDASIDLACLNDTYFDDLEEFVEAAAQRGIVVFITVHDGRTKSSHWTVHPFNNANGNGPLGLNTTYTLLDSYGTEVLGLPLGDFDDWPAARKNQYYQELFVDRLVATVGGCGNVGLELFNEGEFYPREQRSAHELHFASFVKARAPFLLVSSNVDHIDDPLFDAFAVPEIDIIASHGRGITQWLTANDPKPFFDVFDEYGIGPPRKPVIYSETLPEWAGDPGQLKALRRMVWGTVLADSHILVQDQAAFSYCSSCAQDGGAIAEGQRQIGHVQRWVEETDERHAQMRPLARSCSTGICTRQVAAGYAAYYDHSRDTQPVTVNMKGAAGNWISRWLDPESGAWATGGSFVPMGTGSFVPPGTDRDYVLWLEPE